MEEQQTELDFDLGKGKMGLERAPAVTQVLFSPFHFCRLSRFLPYLDPCARARINMQAQVVARHKHAQGVATLFFARSPG